MSSIDEHRPRFQPPRLRLRATATVRPSSIERLNCFTDDLRHRFTAVIVSRFLLNLQAASERIVKLDRDDPLHTVTRQGEDWAPGFTPVAFAHFDVVGSVGSSIVMGDYVGDRDTK